MYVCTVNTNHLLKPPRILSGILKTYIVRRKIFVCSQNLSVVLFRISALTYRSCFCCAKLSSSFFHRMKINLTSRANGGSCSPHVSFSVLPSSAHWRSSACSCFVRACSSTAWSTSVFQPSKSASRWTAKSLASFPAPTTSPVCCAAFLSVTSEE